MLISSRISANLIKILVLQHPLRLNGDGTVTFSVKAPVVGTRSAGDGNTANTLTCYAYDASGNYVDTFSGSMSGGNGSVTARLASGVNYKLVFWSGAADSPYIPWMPKREP